MERFVAELVESLRKQIKEGLTQVYFTAPHALYMTDTQSQLFEAATIHNTSYQNKIDIPIRALLTSKASEIFASITATANFIDLGPGYPSKSLDLIDYLVAQKVRVTYYAVDVSTFFLERAIAAAHARGIPSNRLQRRFEELAQILDKSLAPATPRIIFIGLTFSNFELSEIISILDNVTRKGDLCLVCVQLPSSTSDSESEMIIPYQGEIVKAFAFAPLQLIGFSTEDVEYAPRFFKDAIHADFITIRDVTVHNVQVPKGTRITVGRSYRYPLEYLSSELTKKFDIQKSYLDEANRIALLVLEGR